MKKTLGLIMLATVMLAHGQTVDMTKVVTKKWKGNGTISFSPSESGTVDISARWATDAKKNSNSAMAGFVSFPLVAVSPEVNAVRFEVKGNGADNMASVLLSAGKMPFGFEAAFSLTNDEWHEVEIPLREFSRNYKGVPQPDGYSTYIEQPEALRFIAFGRGLWFHRYAMADWDFSVRNVQLVSDAEVKPVPQVYSKGLEKTHALIRAGKPINILMLGDSITESGRKHSYAHQMAKKLTEKYGVDCAIHNAAIGGHTVRAGHFIFPRSIAKMPDPDLVTIFYGANDCHVTKGAELFQSQIEALIDTVRIATDGKADIMLFTGVQRLNGDKTESNGAVEKLVPGVYAAAKSRETALCDTIPIYAEMDQEKRLKVYKDTIHPTPEGHVFIGGIMHKAITESAGFTKLKIQNN
jgi:lysophospholipase L1-like esterase